MKHLLKHLQNQIRGRLGDLHNGGNVSDKKLEIIYEDLLNKVDQALEELTESGSFSADGNLDHLNFDQNRRNSMESKGITVSDESDEDQTIHHSRIPGIPDAFDGTKEEFAKFAKNFKNVTGKDIFDQWNASQEIFTDLENQSETNEQERSDGPVENDEHHAWQDGGEESFEDLKENVENFTATDLDPDRLRKLANVAEQSDEDSSVDPLEMSDDEFGKILSRLQPNLIDWATGKKENLVESLDQTEVASEIREALRRAQAEHANDGNIDMLRSFQEYVKDSIFDMSRNMDDEYTPEYEDAQHGAGRKDVRTRDEPPTVENKQNIRPNDIHPKNTYE